ncbi:putative chitinase [Microsporum audouinii]
MLTISRDDCVNNCDQKAECNAGWPDSKWSTAEKCPLNVCCSKFGFCGTTKDFCGEDNAVKRPSCDISGTQIKRVIGYYEGWSLTERSCYSMVPEKIPFGVYTYLNFAFATIDPATFKIKPGDSRTEYLMQRISSIKLIQPSIKIWVAVGGWAFNDPGATASIFSDLAASESKQEIFFNSVVKMMNTFGFDGIDIDWEYPVDKDRGGRPEDFKNFVSFIKNLKTRISADSQTRGVSLTLPSNLQHFDIVGLEKYVDWFNLMSYDIHGAWDIGNKWTGSFLNSHTNMTEIQSALDLLWRNDIHPDKVVLGIAFYSRSFTIESISCAEPKCGVISGGIAGKCSHTTGVLLNPKIQDIIKAKGLTPKLYRDEAVKTVSWDNHQDDNKDTNAKALIKASGREIRAWPDFSAQPSKEPPIKATVVRLCRWSNCAKDCPKGFKSVPRDGTNLLMTHNIGCEIYPGRGNSGGQYTFCCPGDLDIPKCRWRGHRNSGACQPGCEKGEVEVGTLADCKWHGSAPICAKSGQHADCSKEFPHFIVAASAGAGGEQTCSQGSKSYYCKEPPPDFATDCAWQKKATDHQKSPIICEPSCPEDQIRVAIHLGDCSVGMQAYCCKGKPPPKLEPRGNGDETFAEGEIKEFTTLLKDSVLYTHSAKFYCQVIIFRPPGILSGDTAGINTGALSPVGPVGPSLYRLLLLHTPFNCSVSPWVAVSFACTLHLKLATYRTPTPTPEREPVLEIVPSTGSSDFSFSPIIPRRLSFSDPDLAPFSPFKAINLLQSEHSMPPITTVRLPEFKLCGQFSGEEKRGAELWLTKLDWELRPMIDYTADPPAVPPADHLMAIKILLIGAAQDWMVEDDHISASMGLGTAEALMLQTICGTAQMSTFIGHELTGTEEPQIT